MGSTISHSGLLGLAGKVKVFTLSPGPGYELLMEHSVQEPLSICLMISFIASLLSSFFPNMFVFLYSIHLGFLLLYLFDLFIIYMLKTFQISLFCPDEGILLGRLARWC